MTRTQLEDALREQLISDVAGLLVWMDDECDTSIPTDRDTAGQVVDTLSDPAMIVVAHPSGDVIMGDDDLHGMVKENNLYRYSAARVGIRHWAVAMTDPLIPANVERSAEMQF